MENYHQSNYHYLCPSWQTFIQMIHHYVSRGYYYYYLGFLPEDKQDKYAQIDQKLIKKYQCDLPTWKKSRQLHPRQKEKGKMIESKKPSIANFQYLRWDKTFIILRTNGALSEGVICDDVFHDVREKMINIKVGPKIGLDIWVGDFKKKEDQSKIKGRMNATVKLDKETFKAIKEDLRYHIKSKHKDQVIAVYARLNNIPSYSYINKQKTQLKRFVMDRCRYYQLKIESKDLHVITFKKQLKVWKDL